MIEKSQMRLIPALLAVAFSGGVQASGFQLLEQNASGIGNAYAGSAAVAENASTIFFNPAGMTQLQAREVSVGVSAINTSYKFKDEGSSVGALAGTGNGGDGGGWGFVPNGYVSWALNKDLYLGIGVGAPFGLKTEYNNPWLGAAQSVSFDVKTYNINPSIAYRVNQQVSLGAGLSWQRLEATYKRQAGVVAIGLIPAPAVAGTPVKLTLDDDSWGWNVGALFTLSPATKVGVSYRSQVKYDLRGKIDLTGPVAPLNALGSSDAKASLTLPDTFILSATHSLSDRVELLGDIARTGWGSIPKLDIVRTSGASNGDTAQTLDTDFRDTWRFAIGANYKYNDAWKLKFGIAYDQTPTKSAATRLVSMPDNNRTWFSVGAQWKPSKEATLDFGVAYLYIKDAKVDNDQTSLDPRQNRGRVTGTFEDSAWILGAQYSMAF